MVVIDWLQTCEFVRVNSERIILYCVCGCLAGISIILLSIIIIFCIEKYCELDYDVDTSPEHDDEYVQKISHLPVYRYNGRTHRELYDV
ncbi:hypothetical protein I4U23_002426 [Adineta vaga]|nr:hypothetical protein I4U23_002426 [Adineta vaga]